MIIINNLPTILTKKPRTLTVIMLVASILGGWKSLSRLSISI
jgi:hypothetical protein